MNTTSIICGNKNPPLRLSACKIGHDHVRDQKFSDIGLADTDTGVYSYFSDPVDSLPTKQQKVNILSVSAWQQTLALENREVPNASMS